MGIIYLGREPPIRLVGKPVTRKIVSESVIRLENKKRKKRKRRKRRRKKEPKFTIKTRKIPQRTLTTPGQITVDPIIGAEKRS